MPQSIADHDLTSDGELLSEFLATSEQMPFEALVRRHAPMVLGVCHRVLGHTQDAEDAMQTTFITLARRAESLRGRESLAGWLYETAWNVSRKSRSSAAIRMRHEGVVRSTRRCTEAEESAWRELGSVLDLELNALPEKYRDVILLHHVEGRSLEQTAQTLNSNAGTIATWLHRGKEMLKFRLERHGVSLTAPSMLALIGTHGAAEQVSASLVSSTAATVVFAKSLFVPAATMGKSALQIATSPVKMAVATVVVSVIAATTIAAAKPDRAPAVPLVIAKATQPEPMVVSDEPESGAAIEEEETPAAPEPPVEPADLLASAESLTEPEALTVPDESKPTVIPDEPAAEWMKPKPELSSMLPDKKVASKKPVDVPEFKKPVNKKPDVVQPPVSKGGKPGKPTVSKFGGTKTASSKPR